MLISFVVPAYNEEACIETCLNSIRDACLAAAQQTAPFDWEMVVTDNNSTDRTRERAEQCGARVVFEPVNQIARARNCGAAAAQGDWLIFIDAYSVLNADLLVDTIEAMRNPCVTAGGAVIRFDHNTDWLLGAGEKVWSVLSRTMGWAAGSYIFCPTALFRETGGFSERLYIAEELDFSRRLKKALHRRNGRFVILARHPLITSNRKAHLYNRWTVVWFLFKAAVMPWRIARNRDACKIWYDGRR